MHIRLLIGIATVIAFAFLVFHLLFGKDSIPEQRRIVKEIELYQKEIDSLTKVLEQRDELIQKLKTDSLYKEEILRTRYGMSREGEKAFQLVK
ncbi:septum formation initiator family protein [Fibrobacter sp. UWB3]|uniref:FtsB family cell division protein n=1 Tax=Fibrobacter sp. UWB3 TaxID=1964357 RepID=UPI000B527695|nr:septum formation initiator family protein [Fibrobacter sp. UWB3]OWV22995.1 septum formation initiator [Fibrobacter sp. UWB3]